MIKSLRTAVLLTGTLPLGIAWAHDLPVSELRVVADESRLHVEITLNAWELRFFGELDVNRDGEIDRAELAEREAEIARLVTDCLVVRFDGALTQADVAGLVPLYNTHHLTFRAHYPLPNSTTVVEIRSRLAAITHAGHVVEVNFRQGENLQRTRLVSSDDVARFNLRKRDAQSTAESPAVHGAASLATGASLNAATPHDLLPATGLALMLLSALLCFSLRLPRLRIP